ncbi:MAG TPA: nitroreductase family deazaflavin-dependent oxidoreductase [Acidimicrobiia bacterium]|nr:nitroreductase family deazaflavin-dependent oxidoreductase [Acidimicrobiia bacterium]
MTSDFDALAHYQTIDLTTTGRRTGQPRTVEIWWFRVDGRFVITGTPGRRDWLANVLADPKIEIGVGGQTLVATGRPVSDPIFRRRVFTDSATSWYTSQAELDHLIDTAPMIEVTFETEG